MEKSMKKNKKYEEKEKEKKKKKKKKRKIIIKLTFPFQVFLKFFQHLHKKFVGYTLMKGNEYHFQSQKTAILKMNSHKKERKKNSKFNLLFQAVYAKKMSTRKRIKLLCFFFFVANLANPFGKGGFIILIFLNEKKSEGINAITIPASRQYLSVSSK